MRSVLILLAAVLTAASVPAAERSSRVRAQFQRERPCPANGATRGNCPGYVADHVIPICAGGPDAIENLQWQRVDDALRKDRLEWAICRKLRQCSAPARS